MKPKHLIVGLVILVWLSAFLSCSLLFPKTTLTIKNSTSGELDLISWNGIYFGKDQVYDQVLGYNVDGLKPGSSDTKEVDPSSDYIFFWLPTPGPKYRTTDLVTVKKNEQKTFTFTNSTIVQQSNSTAPTQQISKVAMGEGISDEARMKKQMEFEGRN
jgi:hypothetical protein